MEDGRRRCRTEDDEEVQVEGVKAGDETVISEVSRPSVAQMRAGLPPRGMTGQDRLAPFGGDEPVDYPHIRPEDYPEWLRDERAQRFLEVVLSGLEMTGVRLANIDRDEARLRIYDARQGVLDHIEAVLVDLGGPVDDENAEIAHISELILQRTYGRILATLDEADGPDEQPVRQTE